MSKPGSRKAATYADPSRKPVIPPPELGGIPPALTGEPRWVLWRLTLKDGRWAKVPVQPSGTTAKTNDPRTWHPFGDVTAAYTRGGFDGIGFVLGGGFAGVDLDDCRDPDTGSLAGPAAALVRQFGTYTEVSPSATGVKLLGRGHWRGDWHRKPLPDGGEIEVYSVVRFFCVTGRTVGTAGLADIQAALDELAGRFGAAGADATPPPGDPGPADPADDDEVIRRALAARNGEKFRRLWSGDTSGHAGDDSAADLALCGMLAFWCAGDAVRVDRLFRRSGLMRPKWDRPAGGGKSYGRRTIEKALAGKTEFYTPRGAPGPRRPATDPGRPGAGDWLPPSPLPEMPPVPPFPLDVFPPKVADYWRAAADSLGCPVDYVAVPGMTLLGAAVGRSRAASVKRTHAAPPLTWSLVIAPPGSAKSPALKFAAAPLYKAEARWLYDHKGEMTVFDAEMERYAAKVKEWKNAGCKGEPPEKPRRPVLRQAILDDTTVEAAVRVLNDNCRGIAVTKDELIGFVQALNQYRSGGKGADREFWLACWAGARAKVNRSKDHDTGPLVVPEPFAAVTGMLCPDRLPVLRGDDARGDAAADGFVDRFLLSFPDPTDAAGETWAEVPERLELGYADVVLDLLGMDMVAEEEVTRTRYRPYFIPFDDGGRREWERFTGELAGRMNAVDRFDPFRGVLSKLRGYGLRLAGLLWCVRRVCGELDPNDPIDAETVRRAARLVAYFEAHARRCLGVGWADRTARVAKRLVGWLERNPDVKIFTRSEAFLALKDRRDVKASKCLDPAFRVLADHQYIRPMDATGPGRPGPVPELYGVNPEWAREAPRNRPLKSLTFRAQEGDC